MASNELIDDIISVEAFKQVEKMQSEMKALMDTFIDAGITVDTLNKALAMQTGMENTTKGINSNKQALSELEKVKAKIITTQEKSNALNTIYGLELERQKQRLAEVNTELQRQEQLRKSEEDSLTALKVKLGFLKEQWSLMGKAAQDANQSMLKEIQQTNVAIREQEKAMSGRVAAVKVAKVALTEQELLINKITKATSQEGQEVALLRVQLAELNKINKQVAQSSSMIDGSIEHMSFTLNRMREQFTKLSPELRNSPFGVELNKRIQTTDTELKKLDAGMGVYKRNVGNYSNATFQLSQSLRELPAFAFSAQTGILALSNNLPMLIDEFNRTSKGVKQVKNELGEMVNDPKGGLNGASGAMKIFGQSIFSFTNLFTIALGLFTVFYKEIIAFATGTKKANKELTDLSKTVGADIAQSKMYIGIIENMNIATEKRIIAAKKLIEIYPETLKNYSAEEIAAGKASEAIDRITNSIIAYARIKAIQTDIDRLATKEYELQGQKQIEIHDQLQMRYEKDAIQSRLKLLKPATNAYDIEIDKLNTINGKISQSQNLVKLYDDQLKIVAGSMTTLSARASDLLPKVLDEKAPKKEKKPKKDKDDKIFTVVPPDLTPTQEEIDNITKYYERLNKERIKILGQMIDDPASREAMLKELALPVVPYEELKLNPKKVKLTPEAKRLIAEQILDGMLQVGQAMGDLAMTVQQAEMYAIDVKQNKMNEYYDAEQKRIEKSFTNKVDREKELQRLAVRKEAEQKQIDRARVEQARKMAKLQRGIDISQIIANTALAVTKALPNYANAAVAAVVGAAQLATVIAKPLPEFAKGTENSPEGYAIVGEKGTELVTDPSGKSWLTPAKDTITYLKKGSKVTTNEKLMEMVKNSAYVQLANLNTPVTSDMYSKTLVEQFETLTSEFKALKGVMQDKAMSVQIQGNYDHYIHVRNNIR